MNARGSLQQMNEISYKFIIWFAFVKEALCSYNLFTFIESHMLKCILVEEINIQKVKKLAENLNPPVRCLPRH